MVPDSLDALARPSDARAPRVGRARLATRRLPARRPQPRPALRAARRARSPSFHVLAPDLLGHGHSPWEPPWDIGAHVDAIVETVGARESRPDRPLLRRAARVRARGARAEARAEARPPRSRRSSSPATSRSPRPRTRASTSRTSPSTSSSSDATTRASSTSRRASSSSRISRRTSRPETTAASATATASRAVVAAYGEMASQPPPFRGRARPDAARPRRALVPPVRPPARRAPRRRSATCSRSSSSPAGTRCSGTRSRRRRARSPRSWRARRRARPRRRRRSRHTARASATSTHSTSACAPSPSGPKRTVGMPAAARSAESAQKDTPTISGSAPRTAVGVAAHGLHDLRVLGDLERLARDGSADARPRSPGRPRRPRDDLPELLLGELGRLARDRPALGLEHAARRVARELLPALDQRRVDAAAADVRVRRIRAQPPVELLDADEDAAHLRDRVDAEVRARAVRRAAVRLDLEMDEAAVRDGDLQLGRLGHDRGVRAQRSPRPPRCRRSRTPRRRRRSGSRRPRRPRRSRLGGREHARREASLHVVRATAVEPAALEARLERIGHPRDADRVHVRVEHQRAAAAGPARDGDDVRPARREPPTSVVSSPARSHHSATKRATSSSPEPPATDVRVDRLDRDELRRQLGDVAHG